MSTDDAIAAAFARIADWLEARAPRTHAALLAPATDGELAAVAAAARRAIPSSVAALYRACGGQGTAAPAAVFGEYFFMPLHGVDGLEVEWEHASEDPAGFVPFAKDFAGNALGVDPTADGAVIERYDGERIQVAPDLASYLSEVADRLEQGSTTIDDSIEELVEVVDAVLEIVERAPGDRVENEVLARLGITATVEPLAAHASKFDVRPYRFGYFVRLSPVEGVAIEHVAFEDERGRAPDYVEYGSSSGGGQPGSVAFARAKDRPLPARSQLRIRLRRTRRS